MNTLKFLNNHSIETSSFQEDITTIRSKLFSYGICWTDDKHGNFSTDKPFRVILYTRTTKIDFKNPMVKECNGLVFEYNNKWALLAMPQPAFCTNKISMKKLTDLNNSGSYDIYEVLDATILTLYYYRGEWRVSSTKGYDIGMTEFVNGYTILECIQDLMDTKYRAFKFESLNKYYSYTIALRYSKYHIFDETKHLANRTKNIPRPDTDMNSYIMILCIADTSNVCFVTKHVSGLPQQNPLKLKDNSIHTLSIYAKSAFAKYAKAHRLQNFKYKPLYGYILRANNRNVPDEYSTIYIESELYKTIKLALYKNNECIRLLNYNKLIIQMAMNHERFEQFKILFRQFDVQFNELDNLIDAISTDVIHRIVDNENTSKSPIQLVNNLVDQFKDEPDATPGLIKDAVFTNSHIEGLIEIFK